jgi:hypothetical protein
MNTLLLDQTTWDLVVDASGNIAVAAAPYATAQDVSSSVKTFMAEVWYNNSLGVPYFQDVLGKLPPIPVLKNYWINAALSVPDVVEAKVLIDSFTMRGLTGQLQFTNSAGQSMGVQL